MSGRHPAGRVNPPRPHEFIDLFYSLASEARAHEHYERGIALEDVGSLVNNVFHGKPFTEWFPQVTDAVEDLVASATGERLEGLREAQVWLEALGEQG